MMNRNFNELPQEVQEEVKSWLRVYDKTYVEYEYGKYKVSSGICLSDTYAPDHEMIGQYTAKEIFTEDERTLNYILTFYDYPIWYTGKRDYKLMKMLQTREWVDEEKTAYRTWTGELDDNKEFKITHMITV